MKKPYSLDFSVEKETDRLAAVNEILDTLERNPSQNELEQMASYILYGKDDEGYNAVQRGEITNNNTRYGSYKRKDDKLLSLDEILENPTTDQQDLQAPHKRSVYTNKKQPIVRPKYDKEGNMTDPGDSTIPHMTDLWEAIDRLEHRIAVVEGKVPPDENTPIEVDSYVLYQWKHTLIDLRRHQYYLRDTYRPTIHLLGIDHPKPQFVDWTSDCFYWVTPEQLQRKLDMSYDPRLSRNLDDYETREDGLKKWVVQQHTFNWEDPLHVRALINNYEAIYDFFYEKLDTYGRTLIFDFERYRAMANFSDVRNFILDLKIARLPYSDISTRLQQKFGLVYNENHLSTILAKEIPQQLADTAKRHRLLIETPPETFKTCFSCGRALPRDALFFTHNRSRKDGLSSNCKDCERKRRIEKGGQPIYDRRNKESTLHQVQDEQAGN